MTYNFPYCLKTAYSGHFRAFIWGKSAVGRLLDIRSASYEADNFRSVTFKNLSRFLDAIGLEITIKETRMTRTNKNKSRKKQSPK